MRMGWCRVDMVALALVVMLLFPLNTHCWGTDGHLTICRIAQSRLSGAAADAVKKLLPDYADNDLGSMCSWADHVKFRYHWSSALHYIDTPDQLCTYNYNRDCKDESGAKERCVAGRLTTIPLSFSPTPTMLLLNLNPLHVGFTSDRGGNTIDVHWFRRKSVLHHVWDSNIIETSEERFYTSNVDNLIDAIQNNITSEWADQVKKWETCSYNDTACPNIYASEGIKAACAWAYKGVTQDSTLEDDYFLSRLPIVYWRLAQGGVRLAATLNRIFS